MNRVFAYILLIVVLTGCSSVKRIYIETHNPAEITFPEEVSRVLIVNNALPQPSDVGYELYILGIEKDTCRANADSALWDACRMLGKAMVDANYFEDVLLYNQSTRTDDAFLADGKLTNRQVAELCAETETDAIISFDRLIFNMRKDVDAFAEGYLQGNIKIDINGIVRAYLPNRAAPLATIAVTDSLLIQEYGMDISILDAFLPSPDEALQMAGKYIGTSLYPTFVPYWEEEMRWYYTGMNSRWKEASAYAAAAKWEDAARSWEILYNKTTDAKTKAKLASNIALGNELSGDFVKASEWATIAKDFFEKEEGIEGNNFQLLKIYEGVLNTRIQSDRKLDIQFGQ